MRLASPFERDEHKSCTRKKHKIGHVLRPTFMSVQSLTELSAAQAFRNSASVRSSAGIGAPKMSYYKNGEVGELVKWSCYSSAQSKTHGRARSCV